MRHIRIERRAAAPAALAAGLIALSACGSAETSTPSAGAGPAAVAIKNFSFMPGSLSVKAGTAVTFTNTDSATHTVTADDKSYNSGDLAQGKGFTHTFASAGRFTYHCAIHQYMTASVVVSG